MRVSVLTCALVLGLTTASCGHAPEAKQEQADIAGIGPRPTVFGRHAWDAAQKRAAARTAEAEAPTPAPTPTQAPAPAPAPAPVAVAAAPQPVPAPAPQPAAPAIATVTPTRIPEPAAPQIAAAAPVPAVIASSPAPAAPPKKAKAAKPVQLAETPAQKGPGLWQRMTAPPPAPALVVGGYGPATDKAAVAAAAAFAVHESPGYVLKAIYSSKVQVVAGTNYSLCLWVRRPTLEPNPLHRRMVAATVFQGLDRHLELTAWKEVEACHAGAQPE